MEDQSVKKKEEVKKKPILVKYEIKPEDYMVDGKQRLMPNIRNPYYKLENLPEREQGAIHRTEGGVILTFFGLSCNSCSHKMPQFAEVLGFVDIFPSSKTVNRVMWKMHLYCPVCNSEMIMEDTTIISGATEYCPPGSQTVRPRIYQQTMVTPSVSGSNKN